MFCLVFSKVKFEVLPFKRVQNHGYIVKVVQEQELSLFSISYILQRICSAESTRNNKVLIEEVTLYSWPLDWHEATHGLKIWSMDIRRKVSQGTQTLVYLRKWKCSFTFWFKDYQNILIYPRLWNNVWFKEVLTV